MLIVKTAGIHLVHFIVSFSKSISTNTHLTYQKKNCFVRVELTIQRENLHISIPITTKYILFVPHLQNCLPIYEPESDYTGT